MSASAPIYAETDPEFWLERAESCRLMADLARSPFRRDNWLKLATVYEDNADKLRRRRRIKAPRRPL